MNLDDLIEVPASSITIDDAQEVIRIKVNDVVNPKLTEMIDAYDKEYGSIIIEKDANG